MKVTNIAQQFWKSHKKSVIQRLPIYASGFMVGLCLTIRGSEWLIFSALVPLLYYVSKFKERKTKQILIDFYALGFIICGFANLFLFQVSPANWAISLNSWFAVLATLLAWLLICGFCAFSFVVFGWVLIKLKKTRWRLAALPILFAAAELLRSYMYAIMAYSPHGSLSPNFNWGSLAVPASGTPLVYSSRIVGFFGLTVLVGVVNVALYLATKRKLVAPTLLIAGVCLVTYIGYLQGKQGHKFISVSVVHLGEQDSVASWDKHNWPLQGIDLLVLPEYSELRKNPDYKQVLGRLSPGGVAVTTERNGTSPTGTNRLIFLNQKGDVVSSQDKTFLIPTGETLPYALQFSFWLIRMRSMNVDFTYSQQITSGQKRETPYSNGTFSVGALACSGVSALSEYSRLSGEGADVLVNSASLSFLTTRSLYHVYARDMARFQAVSNNRPLVQSSRSGESYIMDAQGKIITIWTGDQTHVLSNDHVVLAK